MDSFDDDPFERSSLSSNKDDQEVENVHDLLEEGWFFGKFLTSKPRMPRCYSDPSPNFDQEILAENPSITTYSSSKKVAVGNLIRAPSLPPCIGRCEENIEEKESRSRSRSRSSSSSRVSKLTRQLSDISFAQESANKQACFQYKESSHTRNKMITGQSSKNKLLRTPSLPPCIGREEDAEEIDTDITMSRLIREAMPISSEILPPRRNTSKGMVQSCSITKYRPPRNVTDLGNSNQRSTKKGLTDLESQEVQGLKDLEFAFNKEDLNPRVVGILPGLQDKKNQNPDKYKVKRPYLSEAWHVQRCASPPIPIWASKNSAEDMKLQLKCWARAVASNVR